MTRPKVKVTFDKPDEKLMAEAWQEEDDAWNEYLNKWGIWNLQFEQTPQEYHSVMFMVNFEVGAKKFRKCRLCMSCDRSWYLEPPQLENVQVFNNNSAVNHLQPKGTEGVKWTYCSVVEWPPKFWCRVEDAITAKMLELVEQKRLQIHEIDFNRIVDPARHIYKRLEDTGEVEGWESLVGPVPEYAMEDSNE